MTASSATLTGSFTYEGEETVGIEVGFAYKASGETDYATKTVTASSGDKSAAITGLSAATTYTFHLYASIGGKQYRSQEGTFTTESGTVPPPEKRLSYRLGRVAGGGAEQRLLLCIPYLSRFFGKRTSGT